MYFCGICKKTYLPDVKFNGTFYKTCSICRKRSLEYDNKKKEEFLDDLFMNALKKFDD
jgi:hypothetical protein